MESTAPFRYHHGPRNAHVWFHSERSSTSLWNEITKWRGMYKNATAQSLYTDIFPESHGKVSGRYERESISQNWRTLGPGTGTPKKIYKSANPNLKNPATDSKPKKIRCCMFFGAKVANFLFSTHSPLIFVILPSDIELMRNGHFMHGVFLYGTGSTGNSFKPSRMECCCLCL